MILKQLILNGLAQGCVYLIVALSFAFIYRVVRFFHFSHGIVFAFGPYCALFFVKCLGFSSFYSIPLAILFCGAFGCLMEVTIYRPLRKQGSSPLALLLASLGIYVVAQNAISFLYSDETQSIRQGEIRRGFEFIGAIITPIQIQTILVSLIVAVGSALLLAKTGMGKAMRAVANDLDLARCCGVDSDRIILSTFAIGSALAGLGGTLVALDIDMTPTMGMNPLLMALVAMVVGGIDTIRGITFGALFLGLAQSVAVWKLGSQWQSAIAFIILLIFLVVRPQGRLGYRMRQTQI